MGCVVCTGSRLGTGYTLDWNLLGPPCAITYGSEEWMLSQDMVHSLSDVLLDFIYFFVFPEGRGSWSIWHVCEQK